MEDLERHDEKEEGRDGRKRKDILMVILVQPANYLGRRADQK